MNKKWLIVLAAVGIHISIGSVYAWSVFTVPIMNEFGCTLGSVQFAFSIAIFFLGFSASYLGKYVERLGAKKSGLVSMACFTLSLLGTGLAIYMKSIPLLYLFYGCLGGIGLGIGYITPVGTLVKWFPKNRGFATGCAIMGFGFAATIAGPVIQKLIGIFPLYLVPIILGGIYCVIMTLSSFVFSLPPEGHAGDGDKQIQTGLTSKEAVKKPQFWYAWIILFINIFCGIAIISIASPMSQDLIGFSSTKASLIVGILGVFNGAGRILWASFSDYLGRPNTYILFFILQIGGYTLLSYLTGNIFIAVLCIMISCYGGGFSCIPAYLSDMFGTRQLSAIHGHILTAWAVAGLLAPMYVAFCKSVFHNYTFLLYSFVGLFLVALIMSVILKRTYKRSNKLDTQI